MLKSLNTLPDDPELLKAMVLALQGKVESLEGNERSFLELISQLRLTLAKLRKQRFSSSSEKIDRQIEQLELALEHAQMAHPSPEPEEEQLSAPELASDAPEEPVKPTRGKPGVRP